MRLPSTIKKHRNINFNLNHNAFLMGHDAFSCLFDACL